MQFQLEIQTFKVISKFYFNNLIVKSVDMVGPHCCYNIPLIKSVTHCLTVYFNVDNGVRPTELKKPYEYSFQLLMNLSLFHNYFHTFELHNIRVSFPDIADKHSTNTN